RLHLRRELAAVDLEPRGDGPLVGAADRGRDELELLRLLLERHHVAHADHVARDVEALAVDLHVAVAHELAALGARRGEAHPLDGAVETTLQQREHLLARPAFPAVGLLEVPLELPLEHAVDATRLLLLAETHRVLAELDAPLAVLAGRVGAAR